ncbi:MAG TPA: baseplate J/gp47 family protein, partial [Longimicrobium sp.]
THRVLQPAQPESLFISMMAYRESLLRMQIQDVALQNTVAFARAPMLDYLGELVGTPRLDAAAALVTLTFTLSAPQAGPFTIPSHVRVQTTDGKVTFATVNTAVIPAGALTGTSVAEALSVGAAGNGYAPATVTNVLDPVPGVASVTNLAATSGGADVEDDERYRDRIRRAPERFSVAGSVEAYRFHALSVSTTITAVAVTNPSVGVVRLHVLTRDGAPSAALLDQVKTAVSSERVRPLNDTVEVVAAQEVPYTLSAVLRPLAGADIPATTAAVMAAAEAYAADRRAGLGRDVVPSQVVAALSVPGVYDVTLYAPDGLVEVGPSEWANCVAIDLQAGAAADG